jgi:hypothetical protein
MKQKITVADLVMGAGGAVTFLFSFFAFISAEGFKANAWDGDALAFVSTVPALLGLAMVVWIVLELVGVSLPGAVLSYTPTQLKGTWGISAGGLMIAWLTANDNSGFGFWMMFLGSIAMAVGAVLALLGKGTETVDLPIGGAAQQTVASTGSSGTASPPPPPPPS